MPRRGRSPSVGPKGRVAQGQEVKMKVGNGTIEKALEKHGYSASAWNMMTLKDDLEWEDREDYATIEDAVMAVIEDSVNLAVLSC